MSRLAGGLLPLVISACLWGGSPGDGPPVSDSEALAFAERAQRFYRSLEGVPLDSLLTYEDPKLHAYFASRPAFADYYSALANEVRNAAFRDGRVSRLEILEFRFEADDLARVELRAAGLHQRSLLFWELDIRRTDTWRRVDGVWMLAPDRL